MNSVSGKGLRKLGFRALWRDCGAHRPTLRPHLLRMLWALLLCWFRPRRAGPRVPLATISSLNRKWVCSC